MDMLTQINVFAAVVNKGSFVAAAEQLGMSRPMASKHLARLEYDLGIRLLNRTTRRVALTEEGRAFYDRCKDILENIDEAVREAGESQLTPRGLLRVNAPLSFGYMHLARGVAEYQKKYPEVTVELQLNDRQIDMVEEGFDLSIRIGSLSDSSLVARKLGESRLILCAAPKYLAEHGVPETPEDLAEHNCLRYTYLEHGDLWRFTRNGQVTSVQVGGKLDANNGDALVQAALMGAGIVMQPCYLVGERLKDGSLTRLLPAYDADILGIYAIYPENRRLPQKTRTFIDFLANYFGPLPYWIDEESMRLSA